MKEKIMFLSLKSGFIISSILFIMIMTSCDKKKDVKLFIEKYDTISIKSKGALINNKREGYWVFYYKNGNVKREQVYLMGKINGSVIFYHEDGSRSVVGQMIDDKSSGMWNYYYISGQIKKRGSFHKGLPDGIWEYYAEDGRLDKKLLIDGEKIEVISDNHIGPPINDELPLHSPR